MSVLPDPLREKRFADLVSQLRGMPSPPPSPELTPRVMAAIHVPCAHHRTLVFPVLSAAASFLLLASVCWMACPLVRTQKANLSSPVDILMAAQRSDGRWSADEQDVPSRYDTAVTALAVLALIQADPAEPQGNRAIAIREGLAHLLRQQGPDGRFGPDFSGATYSQYLAEKALESASRIADADPEWRKACERARMNGYSPVEMAQLNRHLAQPMTFPSRWSDAGGPAAQIAIALLQK